MTSKINHAAYDTIADIYDGMHQSDDELDENDQITGLAGYEKGRVLDIGCGTGLFLEYVTPDDYVGIDPSPKMLIKHQRKFPVGPGALTICTTFEDLLPLPEKFDVIIALFGAASYVEPRGWSRLPMFLRPAGHFFLMFYAPDYVPKTHEAGVVLPFHLYTGQPEGVHLRMGNYDLVYGRAAPPSQLVEKETA